jgi:hypothetical protein
MSVTGLCPTCGGDCGAGDCESLSAADAGAQADGFDGFDDEPCEHEHDENCVDELDDSYGNCSHAHYCVCGGCGCPGYCDDTATYNVRPPSETGGAA